MSNPHRRRSAPLTGAIAFCFTFCVAVAPFNLAPFNLALCVSADDAITALRRGSLSIHVLPSLGGRPAAVQWDGDVLTKSVEHEQVAAPGQADVEIDLAPDAASW